jgi:hypothetical protein
LLPGLQDAAYNRMSSQRQAQREKNNAFFANRGFSRDVRKVGGTAAAPFSIRLGFGLLARQHVHCRARL